MARRQGKTRIVAHVDDGFSSTLYLRGDGLSELSWDRGIKMKKNDSADEWFFETNNSFSSGSFKVLVDDKTYEIGDNHPLYPESYIYINPKFPKES